MQEVHEKSLLLKLPNFSHSVSFKCIYSMNRTVIMVMDGDRFQCHKLRDVGSEGCRGIIRVRPVPTSHDFSLAIR